MLITAFVVPKIVKDLLANWKQSFDQLSFRACHDEIPFPIDLLDHPVVILLDKLASAHPQETYQEMLGFILDCPKLIIPYFERAWCLPTAQTDLNETKIISLIAIAKTKGFSNEKSELIQDLLNRELRQQDKALTYLRRHLGDKTDELVAYGLQRPYAIFLALRAFQIDNPTMMSRDSLAMLHNDMEFFITAFSNAFKERYGIAFPIADSDRRTEGDAWWVRWIDQCAVEIKFAKDPITRVQKIISHLYP